jgi:hypothetical protein
LKELFQVFFQDCHLPFKSFLRQLPAPLAQMDRFSEQGLHFLCPAQAWSLLNQSLQVADLMRQANLADYGWCIQLRFPAVAHPDFRLTPSHERFDNILPPTGHNQMIFTVCAHKDPFPPIPSMHTGAGLIAADHFALAHLFANRFGFALRCLACTLHNRNRTTLAQRDPEDFCADLAYSFVSQVMFVVQTRHHRFQTRSKLPSRFQACGELPSAQLTTTRTAHCMLASFYHNRFDLWQFCHLPSYRMFWNPIQ